MIRFVIAVYLNASSIGTPASRPSRSVLLFITEDKAPKEDAPFHTGITRQIINPQTLSTQLMRATPSSHLNFYALW